MEIVWPGEGPLICQHTGPGGRRGPDGGRRCRHHEVDGLGYCVQHVPDDLLEEAEELTGRFRCRDGFGGPGACTQLAVKGTDPPRCKNHGANAGGVISKQAAVRNVEGTVTDRMAEIMAENGDRLLNPRRLGNPLVELLQVAAEMAEWKDILREIVAYLFSRERIRSSHSKVGEQLRAEVLLYERALERLAAALERITKLGIEARLAAIEERQAELVERALTASLTASGLDLVGQEKARAVLRRELMKSARQAS